MSNLAKRIGTLIQSLSEGLVEREQHVRLMLLAALAGEHVLLIGPPGTAKSLLARRLRLAFRDASYFERLLTQFSVPEDLFGPYSLDDLDGGRYRRLTEGYLADTDVGFLDEIFKANPSILNSLLTILNERVFHNVLPEGDPKKPTSKAPHPLQVPLKCLVGASNEVPPPGELDALYDRFLVRCEVGPVVDFKQLLQTSRDEEPNVKCAEQFTAAERDAIHKAAQKVVVPDAVDELLVLMKHRVAEVQLEVSDRRWLKIRRLLQAAAYLNGRKTVSPLEMLLVPHCVWSPRQDQPKAAPTPQKKEQQDSPLSPIEIRNGLTNWLQDRVWEPTPTKPSLLGDQLSAWEQKLETLAKQNAKKRDSAIIAAGVRETQALVQRASDAFESLEETTRALGAHSALNAARTDGDKSPACIDGCMAATKWIAMDDTLAALRRLEDVLQKVAEWKDRSAAIQERFQELHATVTAEPDRAAAKNRTAGKPTRRKITSPRPDPYDFGHSPQAAMALAPECQQKWVDFLSNHPAIASKTREVLQTFKGTADSDECEMEFVLIPPGVFRPGDATSRRRSISSPFLLGTYPVTRWEWRTFCDAPTTEVSVSVYADDRWDYYAEERSYGLKDPLRKMKFKGFCWGRLPANGVSWLETARFCNHLSESQGLEPVYERGPDVRK